MACLVVVRLSDELELLDEQINVSGIRLVIFGHGKNPLPRRCFFGVAVGLEPRATSGNAGTVATGDTYREALPDGKLRLIDFAVSSTRKAWKLPTDKQGYIAPSKVSYRGAKPRKTKYN